MAESDWALEPLIIEYGLRKNVTSKNCMRKDVISQAIPLHITVLSILLNLSGAARHRKCPMDRAFAVANRNYDMGITTEERTV